MKAYHHRKSKFKRVSRKMGAKKNKGTTNHRKAINNMALVNSYISITTLNVNGLNSFTSQKSQNGWIVKKNKTQRMLPTKESIRL